MRSALTLVALLRQHHNSIHKTQDTRHKTQDTRHKTAEDESLFYARHLLDDLQQLKQTNTSIPKLYPK
jgi:RIO-like serine/threonine protein kinase